jgi:hypothetical protein
MAQTDDVMTAKTAVARAVRARDREAERVARAALAAARIKREIVGARLAGVQLSRGQVNELQEALEP